MEILERGSLQMKIKILGIFFIFINFLFAQENFYKNEMRNLIKSIKINSKNKIVILQNGTDIFFDEIDDEKKINKDFLKYVDGVSQESLFFGENGKLNNRTDKVSEKYLLTNLLEIKRNGKTIFNVNYCDTTKSRKVIEKENKKYGFVGEQVPSFSANTFNFPIGNFNQKEVLSLSQSKNFLYILNPEKFSNIDSYYRSLKNSDYDVLIFEPFFNGKLLSKKQIQNLKYKRNGERRLVISYFSIGEAEEYRFYWKKEWNNSLPSWIVKENENWTGNYIVKYWNSEWKKIIFKYQERLNEIGVDGYYLDTIDTFEYF